MKCQDISLFVLVPLKGLTYVPRVIVIDTLKSYGSAKRELLPGVEHCQHRYLNNREENSHQPTR
jgi:putative transposase